MLLVVLHHLGGVLEVPVVLKVQAYIDREPGPFGSEAVVERERQVAGRDRDPEVQAFVAQERAVVGEAADVVGIVGVLERQRQDELVAVIDVLDRRPDVAIAEVPGHVGLELAAPYARKSGVAHTVIVAVEAAHVKVPVLAQRAAGIEVVARQGLGARRGPHGAGELIAPGLVDVVDDGPRRIGAEQRRGAAPHDLQALDVLVEAEEIVGVHEVGVHGGEHRHPVFHEHHVLDPQDAPDRDVLVHLAARALHPGEARHVAQHLGGAPRGGPLDLLGRQGGHRYAGVEVGARRLGGGHDQLLELQRVASQGEVLGGGLAGGHGDAGRVGAESKQARRTSGCRPARG